MYIIKLLGLLFSIIVIYLLYTYKYLNKMYIIKLFGLVLGVIVPITDWNVNYKPSFSFSGFLSRTIRQGRDMAKTKTWSRQDQDNTMTRQRKAIPGQC